MIPVRHDNLILADLKPQITADRFIRPILIASNIGYYPHYQEIKARKDAFIGYLKTELQLSRLSGNCFVVTHHIPDWACFVLCPVSTATVIPVVPIVDVTMEHHVSPYEFHLFPNF